MPEREPSAFVRARESRGPVKSAEYRCRSWYHDRRYRKASYFIGLTNAAEGNLLDSVWAFYVANAGYHAPAEKYLLRAEQAETSIAAGAEGAYLLERGRLNSDPELLEAAVPALDPEWERKYLAEALLELEALYRACGAADAADRAAERLYSINPGVFQGGTARLPLGIPADSGFFLRAALRRGGFNIILPNNEDPGCRYILSVADNHDEVKLYSVEDTHTGEVIITVETDGEPSSPRKASAFAAELNMRFFRITDDDHGPFIKRRMYPFLISCRRQVSLLS